MTRQPFSTTERLCCLRLIRSENVGPITYRELLKRFGSAEAALKQVPHLARRGGRSRIRLCSIDDAKREISAIEKIGARLVCLGEPDYPPILSRIDDAPPTLSIIGHDHLLTQPMIAVVGARNASTNGRLLAEQLARDLSAAGFPVVSGLARGIDTAAHRGALQSANYPGGGTIAIVAGGIDVVYPSENKNLYDQIREQGVVIAEQPPGTEPQARHFPRRNRIISGLARGVLVVEAAPGSGSLITAQLAVDQGREVFAIPGSPLDARARGGNELIRNGATLVEKADDIIFALRGLSGHPDEIFEPGHLFDSSAPQGSLFDFNSVPYQEDIHEISGEDILNLLSTNPVPLDSLITDLGKSAAMVQAGLLELELAGRIQRHPGNHISLAFESGDLLG